MKKIFNTIYNKKNVLITGHTGFKGSWLSLWLTELGANVTGYSLEPPTEPNLFTALHLNEKITHIIADIRDENKLHEVIKKQKPDIIFHLAAQPLVRLSYSEPKLTYETNIIGTINLFEAIKKSKSVRTVINVTSDKCYENREWIYGYRENDPFGGYDPYSSSKGCSEIITAAYRKSFFNPSDYGKTHKISLASARAGNVIGGGDWAQDRLIPDCIKSLTKKETIVLRNPKSTRPWQHVLEPLSGYLWLGAMSWIKPGLYCEGWNFGPNDNDIIAVEEVVRKLIELWGTGKYKVKHNKNLHEASLLKLDITKARSFLNWTPVYSIYDSLKETASWYSEYYKNNSKDMYKVTLNQIYNYIESAKEKNLEWANK